METERKSDAFAMVMCVRSSGKSYADSMLVGGEIARCRVPAPHDHRPVTGQNHVRHGRHSRLALLHPSRLPIPSAFDGPVPARMNEILSPLRRILDGYKKEEQCEEVGREEGDQEKDGEEGNEEGPGEEEAHAERRVHEADAAG
jgi:hypothetical protein